MIQNNLPLDPIDKAVFSAEREYLEARSDNNPLHRNPEQPKNKKRGGKGAGGGEKKKKKKTKGNEIKVTMS